MCTSRIYIIDDHPIIRYGLKLLINQEKDLAVCGEADSLDQAMKDVSREKPDLIILDLMLEKGSALEFIKYLQQQSRSIPVLVLSMHDETYYAERVLRAGAKGYIMKDSATDHLVQAVRTILQGEVYLSDRMKSRLISSIAGIRKKKVEADRLTDREMEVFQLIGQGLSTREIAAKLCLSVKTIETHKENLKRKLKLSNATELIQQATLWNMQNRTPEES